jgi:phosphoglycolate phosphatase
LYPGVIFDLDGTLLNTLQDLANASNYTLQVLGFSTHPTESYKQMVGSGIPKLIERFLPPKQCTPALCEQAAAVFYPYYEAHKQDATAPYAGIVPMLQRLQAAHIQLGVVSNKSDALTQSIVAHYFPGIFSHVAGLLPGAAPKPNPQRVNEVRAAMQLDAAQVLYVGDSDVDMHTARNAQLTSCGVLWGFRNREELLHAGAAFLADTPDALERIILHGV